MTASENHALIRPIHGEPGRYHVRSQSHPDGCADHDGWHLVDVAEHAGCGECSCIRWRTVCWPLIRDTQGLPPSKRCRHLRAAREAFCNEAVKKLIHHG